jgi:hypothetical protein
MWVLTWVNNPFRYVICSACHWWSSL